MRAAAAGDFSHRLPARRKGVVGELEAAYNQLVERNAQLTAELVRLGRVVGREGRMTERASVEGAHGGWSDRAGLGQRPRRRPRPPHHRGRARDRRRGRGRPDPEDGADHRGPAAEGRVRPHRHHGERDGRPARLLRRRGLARGARGRHRGQARRPGRGPRRRRHVEGPDRQRQLHGLEPDRPGAQHRPGHHGGGQRRPLPEDHRGRQGRGPRAQAARSTRWSTSCAPSPTRSPAWRARSAPRASSAARPRCATSPACGAT